MKLFHTSDWHLGRSLYAKKRYNEFQKFLDWLVLQIKSAAPEILIIAGDIFDTTTPSNKAQEMYYQFLCQVALNSSTQHVVVIGGNHDSPTLLNAPKEILKHLQIHVVASSSDELSDELLELSDASGNLIALICAVPYLRDRDVRRISENESAADKDLKLMQGIKEHYRAVCDLAIQRRNKLALPIPIVALGHLFVSGGKTQADDGVRELYIGSLARFGSQDFPAEIDYLALGHLHVPQRVAGRDNFRYCGSPLAMGFAEAYQQKIILSVEFKQNNLFEIQEIAIPQFQRLERINGDLSTLSAELNQLKLSAESIWVEVNYTGKEIISNLQHFLDAIVANSAIELIKVYNRQLINQVLASNLLNGEIDLHDLTAQQVFQQCLQQNAIPLQQQAELRQCYGQVLLELAAVGDE